MIQTYKTHIQAWLIFSTAILVISCGGGSDNSNELNNSVSVRGLELHPNAHVIPSDGSVIVTAIGEEGIQFRGDGVPTMNAGDYVVAVAPITDEARANINHIGGYAQFGKGGHIVPHAMMPERYKTIGNNDYSHFVIHFSKVQEQVVDTGPLAAEGSRAFGDNVTTRGFASFVSHGISDVASSVSSAATSATSVATNAAGDVTNAATSVTNATGVSQVVSTAESAVSSAVSAVTSEIGAVGDLITTIESAGVHFSEVVKEAAIDIEKVATDPMTLLEDAANFAKFLVTGSAQASFSSAGELDINFDNANVKYTGKDENGDSVSLAAVVDGKLSYKYSESGQLVIKNYVPSSFNVDFTPSGNLDISITKLVGEGKVQIGNYKLNPIILDAGIPVVIIREIEVSLEASTASEVNMNFNADLSMKAGFTATSSGFSPSGSAVGNINASLKTLPKNDASVSFVVTPKFKMYDLAGPFLKATVAKLDIDTVRLSKATSSNATIGMNLESIGYKGWSFSKEIFDINWQTSSGGIPVENN